MPATRETIATSKREDANAEGRTTCMSIAYQPVGKMATKIGAADSVILAAARTVPGGSRMS
jgi:hypothetical protein